MRMPIISSEGFVWNSTSIQTHMNAVNGLQPIEVFHRRWKTIVQWIRSLVAEVDGNEVFCTKFSIFSLIKIHFSGLILFENCIPNLSSNDRFPILYENAHGTREISPNIGVDHHVQRCRRGWNSLFECQRAATIELLSLYQTWHRYESHCTHD